MSAYLLDTNVLAEEMQARPDQTVQAWMNAHRAQSYTSAITIGEIARGIRRLAPGRKRAALESWFTSLLASFQSRVLNYNERTALIWGELQASLEKAGRTMPLQDSCVAAVALRHGLTIATRNTADFAPAGIRTINPFPTS